MRAIILGVSLVTQACRAGQTPRTCRLLHLVFVAERLGQNLLCVVGFGKNLVLRLEDIDVDDRPKYFFLHDLGVFRCVLEDSRFDIVALAIGGSIATNQQLPTGLLARLKVVQHRLVLNLVGLRSVVRALLKRIAHVDFILEIMLEQVNVLVRDGILNVDARVGHTNLSAVPLDTVRCFLHRFFDVGVLEYDSW